MLLFAQQLQHKLRSSPSFYKFYVDSPETDIEVIGGGGGGFDLALVTVVVVLVKADTVLTMLWRGLLDKAGWRSRLCNVTREGPVCFQYVGTEYLEECSSCFLCIKNTVLCR